MAVRELIDVLLDQGSFVEIHAGESCGVTACMGTVQQRPISILAIEKAVLGHVSMAKARRLLDKTLMIGAPLVILFEDDEDVADQDGLMQVIKQIVRLSGVCPILALVCNGIGGMDRKMLPFADFCIHCNAENISAGCHTLVSADVPAGMEKLRTLVSLLPSNCAEDAPLLDASDDNDRSRNTKTQDFVQMLADTDSLLTLYCDQHAQAAIGRFGGRVAGIVAADDVLPCDAARFVQFCDCYALPVIWITEKCLPHHEQLLYMLARATTVKVLIALNEADSAAALFDVVLSRPESETVGKADDVAAGEELRQLLFNTLELLSVKRDVLPPHKHGNMPL